MTELKKCLFTAKATIGTGGGKTISPRVELFFPDVYVRVTEAKGN